MAHNHKPKVHQYLWPRSFWPSNLPWTTVFLQHPFIKKILLWYWLSLVPWTPEQLSWCSPPPQSVASVITQWGPGQLLSQDLRFIPAQSPFGLALSALPVVWVIPFKMQQPRGGTDRLWWRGAEGRDRCCFYFVIAFTQVLQGKCYQEAVKGHLFLESPIHLCVTFTLWGMIYPFRRKGLSHSSAITSKSPSGGR